MLSIVSTTIDLQKMLIFEKQFSFTSKTTRQIIKSRLLFKTSLFPDNKVTRWQQFTA